MHLLNTLPHPLRLLAFAAALMVLCAPLTALGHPTTVGNTLIHIKPETQEVDILASVSRDDLAEYLKLDRDGNNIADADEIKAGEGVIMDYMSARLTVTNGGKPCAMREKRFVPDTSKQRRVHLMAALRCDAPLAGIAISNSILFEDTGGHRHYARIQHGETVETTTFAREFPTYVLNVASPDGAAAPAAASSLLDVAIQYTWEGILHILIGLDHVLFVICLLLLAQKGTRLALVITAFTLGHSVTLALSALNWVAVPAAVIEPIIALSILVIAVENIIASRKEEIEEPKHRYVITALFGLIHGFGFSYVLRDEVGLPTDALIPALLTFNIGVELGQLAIVAVCWPLLRWAMRSERYRYVVWALSGTVGVLALWWVVERTFL